MRAPTLTQQVDVKILSARIVCVVALASEHSVLEALILCLAFCVVQMFVVQFYPWFKFYFPLFQPHYHIS